MADHATAVAAKPTPDSHASASKPSRKAAPLFEAEVLARTLLTVPEAAFLLRVAVRTVWRLMADSKAGFPKPRRLRGRTLLVRDEVLAFLAKGGNAR